jgi:hypothetical protein
MKKIFANTTLIIVALDEGESISEPWRGEPGHFIAKLNRCIGSTMVRPILEKVQVAHEIWTYNPSEKKFRAFKNKGIGNEICDYMAKHGINLKVSSAKISDATAQTLRFDTDKDLFHFNLKYL